MKSILLIIFLILLHAPSVFSQKREKFIFYKISNNKTQTIKSNQTILVNLKEQKNIGDTLYQSVFYFGDIIDKTDSFLVLNNVVYTHELHLINNKKEEQINEQIEYKDTIIEIPLKKIRYIQKDNKIQRITPVIAMFTALTGSFLAPIIAYNFKNKSFNAETYGAIAVPSAFVSLGAITIGTSYQRKKLSVFPSSVE